MRGAITGLVCALAASACAGDLSDTAHAERGADGDRWTPLEEAAVVDLHLGPQGGQHLAAGTRIDGLFPGERDDGTDRPRVGYTVRDLSGALWSAALRPVRSAFVPCPAGGFELADSATIFMVEGAETLDGAAVEVRVDVEDTGGLTAADTRLVTVRLVAD